MANVVVWEGSRRADWRSVAHERLLDAQALLSARWWGGAWYMAGYAVECGLKACIARRFASGVIPRRGSVDRIYVHDLVALLKLAQLDAIQRAHARIDPNFAVHWANVQTWDPEQRYTASRVRREAEDMVNGVADPQHGVLQWLRHHW